MSIVSTPLSIAAASGIVASALVNGAGYSISLFSIPAIVQGAPTTDVLVRQWQLVFEKGKALFPVFAAGTALNYLYVAYRSRSRDLEWRGFAAGGVLQVAIVPFTLLFIAGVNSRLLAVADPKTKKEMSKEVAKALVGQWGRLNAVRSSIGLLGTAAAVWNLLT
ncbi:hypothetical protein SLS62_010648 [Diatrype stigma]|uniref:DUF1772-domain-containing protein n=1 Tax=Diatrype stigma TaxID=117547 RepID=A0AAN9U8J7_9PEZI